jgi:hypothetical protein
LWRAVSELAQRFDEALPATEPSFDFVVPARARRLQHKTARLLASRLQLTDRHDDHRHRQGRRARSG